MKSHWFYTIQNPFFKTITPNMNGNPFVHNLGSINHCSDTDNKAEIASLCLIGEI